MDSTSPDRDGPPLSEEDDGSLSVAAGLAKEAALLFQDGQFRDCLRILNQLLLKKADDPKVRHNIAITKTFQDGCSDPKRLIEALENIKTQIEGLAQAHEDHLEISSNNGSHPAEGVGETDSTVLQLSSSSIVYCNEVDTSVAMFNIAVVWLHLHQYARSFSYLDTLYQNIAPIDQATAFRICLLLLDVALLSHHASRSVDVISYMERALYASMSSSQVENGTSAQQQSLLVAKSNSLPSDSTIHDASHSDSVTADGLETSLTNTLSEEDPLEDEQLLSSLHISGQKPQNFQRPPVIASSNDLPRTLPDESLSAIELRLKLYKVRFFILTRNLKAARVEIKSAMNLARGKDNTMALYLKSQLEYARGNHQKAIRLLEAPNNHTETGISNMYYYNNLGCIHHRLGKYNLSDVYLSKALGISLLVRKEKNPKLTLSQDNTLLIMYNCGISSLVCGKPFLAAHCFRKASAIFYDRPLLWLRIAECCLMALEKGLITSVGSVSDNSDIRVDVIGDGKWRWCGILPYGNDDLVPSNGKQPDLSMEFARQCLFNALHLLECSDERNSRSDSPPSFDESESRETHKNVSDGDTKAQNASSQINSNGDVKIGHSRGASLQNSFPDYKRICIKENRIMKQAAYADLAYVELALENPLNALKMAKSLLELPDCSKVYIFLGTMYIAEALCLLNRPNEAAAHLIKYVSSGDEEVLLPYNQDDCENWTVEKVADSTESNGGGTKVPNANPSSDESQWSMIRKTEEARGIFCVNYAVQFAMLGNLEKAHHFVTKALSALPNSPQAILTAIYVDLKRGAMQEALAKLRQHSRVRFLRRNLPLKGPS